MKREKHDYEVKTLEAELRKESYRYQLALKDGAVTSIVTDIVKKISDLEEELKTRRGTTIGAPQP